MTQSPQSFRTMVWKTTITLSLIFTTVQVSLAQDKDNIKPHFENSGEIIKAGIELFDRAEYDSAIVEFNKVHPMDTNYTWACYEKSMALSSAEKYREAIALGEFNLKAGYLEPLQFNVIGTAYDELKESDKAMDAYDRGLKLYPYSNELRFNRAVVYEVAKKYDESIKAHQENLKINPFNLSSHIRLGKLAGRQGHYTEALLSLITYLIIEPTSGRSLNVLNNADQIASLNWKELSTIDPVSETEFKEIDFIIANRIALSEKYKTPSDFDFPVIKQLYAILEKLKETKTLGDGFWATEYGAFYKEIAKTVNYQDLSLLILASVEDAQVSKPLSKRLEEIKALRIKLIERWLKLHDSMVVQRDGQDWKARYSFEAEEYTINGLTTVDAEGKKTGYQEMYYADGSIEGKGQMVKDLREGPWVYYYSTGEKLSEFGYKEDKRTGPYKVWYKNGNLKEEGTMLNDELDGEWKFYSQLGVLNVKENYRDGKEHGKGSRYFPGGQLEYEYNMIDGKLDGKLIEYYSTGQVFSEVSFVEGEKDGLQKKYFPDGQVSLEQTFVKDQIEGTYKAYFTNGKVESEGQTKADNGIGVWKYYYPTGKIREERNLNDEGKEHGPSIEFAETGQAYKTYEFSNGVLKSVIFQDTAGKVLYQGKIGTKGTSMEEYDARGVKIGEGTMYSKGKEGLWTYYNEYGALRQTIPYVDGRENGAVKNYFTNGDLETVTHFKEGEWDGLYTDKFLSGHISNTGNYVKGKKWQEWIELNNDGTLAAKYWYQKDELCGLQEYFDCYGRPDYREWHDKNGVFVAMTVLDSTGAVIDSIYLKNGTGPIKLKYYTGSTYYQGNYVAGEREGIFRWYYPNGQILSEGQYLAGRKKELWSSYHPNGKLRERGAYLYGEKIGKWEEFDYFGVKVNEFNYSYGKRDGMATFYRQDGSREQEQIFRNGELHGLWKFFAPGGELKVARLYDNGTLIGYAEPDAEGKLKAIVPVKLGTAEIRSNYANGKPSVSYKYEKGDLNGEMVHYYPSGQVMFKDKFENGQSQGPVVIYYANGQIAEAATNVNNRLEGKFQQFYENGKLKMEGYYHMDAKHGEFRYFDNTGKLLGAYQYYNDVIVKTLN